ncbi:MAG TPA: ArsR family transcriptional regulator, partial [Elusimicrobia bacterium]|nr:ArsR family transcriptional regulator [Elusimicrobiota bacterium]
ALGHPVRLKIMEYLKDKEKCVCEIFPYLKMEQSHLSKHLAILRKAEIVDVRREGKNIFYKLKNQQVSRLLDCVKNVLRKEIKEKQKLLRQI